MKIAVAGGTGTAGRYAVEAAAAAGHDTVVVSRRRGVDVRTRRQLAEALAGVDVVIDAMTVRSLRQTTAEAFFTEASRLLQEVGRAAGVQHLVTLSIVGIDRASGYGYYRAKLAQERTATSGPVPATILRATQFHEFPGQILATTRRGPLALMFRMRSQPVAARTVGEHLVRAAEDRPGGMRELAGPGVHEMPDLARRLLAARGIRATVLPLPLPGAGGRAMRSGALLATDRTTIDGPPFGEWLHTEDAQAIPL